MVAHLLGVVHHAPVAGVEKLYPAVRPPRGVQFCKYRIQRLTHHSVFLAAVEAYEVDTARCVVAHKRGERLLDIFHPAGIIVGERFRIGIVAEGVEPCRLAVAGHSQLVFAENGHETFMIGVAHHSLRLRVHIVVDNHRHTRSVENPRQRSQPHFKSALIRYALRQNEYVDITVVVEKMHQPRIRLLLLRGIERAALPVEHRVEFFLRHFKAIDTQFLEILMLEQLVETVYILENLCARVGKLIGAKIRAVGAHISDIIKRVKFGKYRRNITIPLQIKQLPARPACINVFLPLVFFAYINNMVVVPPLKNLIFSSWFQIFENIAAASVVNIGGIILRNSPHGQHRQVIGKFAHTFSEASHSAQFRRHGQVGRQFPKRGQGLANLVVQRRIKHILLHCKKNVKSNLDSTNIQNISQYPKFPGTQSLLPLKKIDLFRGISI